MDLRFPCKQICALATIAAILSLFSTGCVTKPIAGQNVEAAHRLAILFILYDNLHSGWEYPTNIAELDTKLREAGFVEPIPKYKYANGESRNFVYIEGFQRTDGNDWVFLISPEDTNSASRVVAYLDATTKLIPANVAAAEVERSHDFIKSRAGNK
jgi:hypothetical protein